MTTYYRDRDDIYTTWGGGIVRDISDTVFAVYRESMKSWVIFTKEDGSGGNVRFPWKEAMTLNNIEMIEEE